MDRCCVCGKELEIMDSYQLFSTKRLYICDDCFDMKSKLISVNPMERLRAKEYMTILLEEGLVDEIQGCGGCQRPRCGILCRFRKRAQDRLQ